jgi:hypothetical protein
VRLLASILVCSSAAAFSAAQTPAAPAAAPTQSFERFRIGSDTDVSPTTTGGLQLEGGGTDQPDAFNWLVEHANGGDILVIRASGTGAYNDFIAKQGATNSVETIVFHDRAASSDPYVLNRLAHAEAIFLAGATAAYYMRAATMPSVCRKGAPLSMAGIEVYRVKAGGHFNLKTWTGDGGLAYTLTVTNGVVTSSKGDLY